LLFNRKKGKLSTEQKTFYDGKLKEIQQIFSLSTNVDEDGPESDKGKKIESANTDTDAEMKKLCESSVSKAAKMAAGYVYPSLPCEFKTSMLVLIFSFVKY